MSGNDPKDPKDPTQFDPSELPPQIEAIYRRLQKMIKGGVNPGQLTYYVQLGSEPAKTPSGQSYEKVDRNPDVWVKMKASTICTTQNALRRTIDLLTKIVPPDKQTVRAGIDLVLLDSLMEFLSGIDQDLHDLDYDKMEADINRGKSPQQDVPVQSHPGAKVIYGNFKPFTPQDGLPDITFWDPNGGPDNAH